jgi:hypothetical protein
MDYLKQLQSLHQIKQLAIKVDEFAIISKIEAREKQIWSEMQALGAIDIINLSKTEPIWQINGDGTKEIISVFVDGKEYVMPNWMRRFIKEQL